jgi:hypothetical protein
VTLFSLGKYGYQVIVTNLWINPLNVWEFYNVRAGVELIIKELKGDYPLAKIPTNHFATNEAYFHSRNSAEMLSATGRFHGPELVRRQRGARPATPCLDLSPISFRYINFL